MLDTKGPEIRTGLLKDHQPVTYEANSSVFITTDYTVEGDATTIACSYPSLPETVQVGSTIYIADGALTVEVTEIKEVSSCLNNEEQTRQLILVKDKDNKIS